MEGLIRVSTDTVRIRITSQDKDLSIKENLSKRDNKSNCQGKLKQMKCVFFGSYVIVSVVKGCQRGVSSRYGILEYGRILKEVTLLV